MTCKLYIFCRQNSENSDISHAFKPLTVAKLSMLKIIVFWLTQYYDNYVVRRPKTYSDQVSKAEMKSSTAVETETHLSLHLGPVLREDQQIQ